ncbi:fatty acid desaturase, putative [Trypanosoma equiperdum]|uniref:Fatty acid desaturase, putative n=2 Tax=Trypanozoon TaxID=39700 RepID=Q587G0_TRYB2|nr:fatty acid desaturase, putative [Trypanosoma brucei brucei TREU927]AAQ15765.1 fatty acid desaturase, putative [Trypanosoma brucei brucei TREU927]AAX78904.1 fatty acid desaturase, putative [Trypanosoma brucei]SCU64793.1 fatty acid desaturase, putative [Trypanosoma equiperdum]
MLPKQQMGGSVCNASIETVNTEATDPSEAKKIVLNAGRSEKVNVYVPPSTLMVRDIQEQIPAEYFQRSMWRSFSYLSRDMFQLFLTFVIMYNFVLPMLDSSLLNAVPPVAWLSRAAAWMIYWFIQGLNGTALWVLAHECGHQAFCNSRRVNNAVGMILHSALLVPYHSWRLTHGTHHKHTNHLTKDLVFVPVQRSAVGEAVEEAPIVMLWNMALMFLFGWPMHLLVNVGGQKFDRFTSHFDPNAPFFRRADYNNVMVSNMGVLLTLSILGACSWSFGFAVVVRWYLIPYLWVNFWLVYITYMQHSDVRLPHYTHDHWTYVRGAVAAVDRDFGPLLNSWLHHINDSHVVHHLFSQMPHYNAIEVTRKHIRDILGDLYVTDAKPLLKSLVHTWRECRYVVPSEGICIYRS